jgi:putative transcriptional regulator
VNVAENTNIGDALIAALEEAVAYERGELPGLRVDRVAITARGARVDPAPEYSPEEIRAIRHSLSLSQQVFADVLNASASAVRAWEQGTREPDGPTRRLLQVAEEHPDVLMALVDQTRPQPYPSPEGYGVMMAAETPQLPNGTPRKSSQAPPIPYGPPRRKSSRK